MATYPERSELDRDEQIARISKLVDDVVKSQAETRKLVTETEYLPRTVAFQAMIATAGLLGAGAAVAKLFFP